MISKNKKTILVADDEEDIRDIVRFHLESEGYHVITSKNGEEAIHALNEFDISLAITDLKMSKMDGFEVLDYVRNRNSFVPVIVLTGYVDPDMVVSSMKKGAADYIPKPVKRDEFLGIVKKVLDRRRVLTIPRHFDITGIYLLDKAGILLHHEDVCSSPDFDADIFGSMFTAVKTFITDSFHSDGGLKIIEHGSYKILVEEGYDVFLVVIGKGDRVEEVRHQMKIAIEGVNERFGEVISKWDGNENKLPGLKREFDGLVNLCNRNQMLHIGGVYDQRSMGRELKLRYSKKRYKSL